MHAQRQNLSTKTGVLRFFCVDENSQEVEKMVRWQTKAAEVAIGWDKLDPSRIITLHNAEAESCRGFTVALRVSNPRRPNCLRRKLAIGNSSRDAQLHLSHKM